MKKKHLVIVGVIILSAIVILGLYQTFALSGDITKDTNGYYNVTVTMELLSQYLQIALKQYTIN